MAEQFESKTLSLLRDRAQSGEWWIIASSGQCRTFVADQIDQKLGADANSMEVLLLHVEGLGGIALAMIPRNKLSKSQLDDCLGEFDDPLMSTSMPGPCDVILARNVTPEAKIEAMRFWLKSLVTPQLHAV